MRNGDPVIYSALSQYFNVGRNSRYRNKFRSEMVCAGESGAADRGAGRGRERELFGAGSQQT